MTRTWGIVPAAGQGSRIQPLAFSKELLPVGSRVDENGVERPRAVSEHLLERMVLGGADRILLVISPLKSDILRYYGSHYGTASIAYAVQERSAGLCDAIFRAVPFVRPDEAVLVGLPDTVWFPADALRGLAEDRFSFLLFPVARPELFDAVDTAADGRVREVQVKRLNPATHWIWGACKMPGATLLGLHALWLERGRRDEFIGTLVNAWIALGHPAWGVRAGGSYVDTGTLNGYRDATRLLDAPASGTDAPLVR